MAALRYAPVEPNLPTWADALLRRWPGHAFVAEPVEAWVEPGAPFQDRTLRDIRQYLFLEHGAATVEVAGGELQVPAGSLLLIPPGLPCAVRLSQDVRGIWMGGTEAFVLASITPSMFRLPPESWEGVYSPTLMPLARGEANAGRRAQVLKELMAARERLPVSQVAVATYMLMIFNCEMLGRDAEGRPTGTVMEPIRDPDVRLMLAYRGAVEAHLADKLTVEDYARKLGVTLERLTRACRTTDGITPLGLLVNRAIQRAKVDLRYSADPVTLVGQRVGFPDPAHFSRFFKRHAGHSPSRYRELCQENGAAPRPHDVEFTTTTMGALFRPQAPPVTDPDPS